MDGTFIGKIKSVKYGFWDRHTYFGLQLELRFGGNVINTSIGYLDSR